MAGNIIPAIATTNAITAGVVVMHAFKALAGEYEKCKSVYMRNTLNPQNYLLAPEKMIQPPNPKCYVCAPKPQVCLQVDTSKLTVKELRDDVLIKTLNMIDPDVMLESKGIIVISSEEGETDCNNNKKLDELYIKQRVEVQDADEEDDDDLLLIEDDETEDATAAAPSTSNATNLKRKPADNVAGEGCSKKAKIDDSDDDLIMIEEDD
uniref:Ubiquitin/SUMO-activating enzyme ubiquitin-like domain-containing protein n=1 Tax=Megaselia scalaris TaxID=36166 RepID=T1H4C6_MEGSC